MSEQEEHPLVKDGRFLADCINHRQTQTGVSMHALIAYGWYDDPMQTTPTHDPGLQVPCPICCSGLASEPRVTISVCAQRAERSLFFRAHKRCWNDTTEDKRQDIESRVIDEDAQTVQ